MVKRIAVTGGGGQISYSLLFQIANGDLFGDKEAISLSICDLPQMEGMLQGVAMELEDCTFPLLQEIRIETDPRKAFEKADCAFLVGAKPRGPGMERADLLLENGEIFVKEGRALNEAASKNVKVLVVGNPCNTNCLIALHHAPNIPKKNFHAMMRLDENRSKALLAKKAKTHASRIKQLVVWGNHSSTQIPDFTHAKIHGKQVLEIIQDKTWLQEDFIAQVQKRGSAVIKARGKSSAASAAHAAIGAMRSLFIPTPEGEWFTSAVYSGENPYGIEKNLIFGFPCRSKGDGDYEIVQGISWDPFIREKINLTQKELIEERNTIQNILQP